MNEIAFLDHATPCQMDLLWSLGWRNFGRRFFRYSQFPYDRRCLTILPLRIDIRAFSLSDSQRRTLRRNVDLLWHVGPATTDQEHQDLLKRHALRFKENRPESPHDFLGDGVQDSRPCEVREISARNKEGDLLAASYIGVGEEAFSSIHAMFDPEVHRRRLGIATLLREVEETRITGRRFLYLGYATVEPSLDDYKKGFAGLEWYDWERWHDTPVPGK
jgi:arginyl-tRNA--protein-N-Asp/Glu arginylyltransferase